MSIIVFAKSIAHYRRLFNKLSPITKRGVILLVELKLEYLILPFQAIK
jgi:hypothetical protein